MKKQITMEITFWCKIIRNAFILAGLYFVSVWASGDLTYSLCKPIMIFFLTYCFSELARHYGITKVARGKNGSTFIFT